MRRYFLIFNLFLTLTAVAVGWKIRKDWLVYAVKNRPQSLVLRPFVGTQSFRAPVSPDYSVIASQNPFEADRNDVIEQPQVQVTIAPPPLFYGSVILGDDRYAMMATDEAAAPQKIQEGQSINGYRLARIQAQSVILDSGSGPTEIMLYNAMSKLKRDHSRTVAAVSASATAATTQLSTSSPAPAAQSTATAAPSGVSVPRAPVQAPLPAGKKMVETPFGAIAVDAQ